MKLVLIILVILLLSGAGGYRGQQTWGGYYGPGISIFSILILLLLARLFGLI